MTPVPERLGRCCTMPINDRFSKTLLQKSGLALWILSVGLVCYYSLQPGVELPASFWNADKAFHLAGYLWLAFLPGLIFSGRKTALSASLSMLLLGLLLEACQAFIPGRHFSVGDVAANSGGVLMGAWLAFRIRPLARLALLPSSQSGPGTQF